MMESMWVVEYSKTQDCFHISTLKESVETNERAFRQRNNNDYQIIALADTFEEASNKANKYRSFCYKVVK